MCERGVEQQAAANFPSALGIFPYLALSIAHRGHPRPAGSNIGVRFHEADLTLQPLGQTDVVSVHPSDVFTACQFKAAIKRSYQPDLVLVVDEANTGVGVSFDNFDASIGGTVVDDQEFEVSDSVNCRA
jgi:hypothetical protein